MKLGCVFTQTGRDEKGRPRRDPSTTFIGAIETADAFGWRLYGEARRRGLDRAERVVVLGDGPNGSKASSIYTFPKPPDCEACLGYCFSRRSGKSIAIECLVESNEKIAAKPATYRRASLDLKAPDSWGCGSQDRCSNVRLSLRGAKSLLFAVSANPTA